MSFVNGISFLIIFLLELVLAIVWIKKFQLYKYCSIAKYGLSLYIITWYLILLDVGSGLDNLQKFLGSILSESTMSSNSSKNFYIMLSFLHYVLLTFLVVSCAYFVTKPKVDDEDTQKNNINIENDRIEINHSSSNVCNYNICIWIFAVLINITLVVFGTYTWITFSFENLEFIQEYTIWKWKKNDDIEYDFIQTIGDQIPTITSILTLIMNCIIWHKYRYWVPFIWTLISIVCIFILVIFWSTGFFYIGNLFEWTLYVGYYILEVFMYYISDDDDDDEKKLTTDINMSTTV